MNDETQRPPEPPAQNAEEPIAPPERPAHRAQPWVHAPWQRAVLWGVLGLGIGGALWPVGQGAYGWWSQRALQQSWQHAWEAQARAAQAQEAEAQGAMRLKSQGKPQTGFGSGSELSRRKSEPRGGAGRQSRQRWLPTRIVIPDIGVDAVVVRGLDEAALQRGPGHDLSSALPGQPGNCVIAAHRNAYGWWFYKLNRLGSGARVELRTPHATHVYAVAATRVLPETATWALRAPHAASAPRLTLYTCALPRGPHRIVVWATLLRREPPSR